MKTIKLQFANEQGHQLSAWLEMPVNKKPVAYALMAHCFTCTKNLMAVTNISRALTAKNIAVMRFDFTGLGESEGDFADTNFSGNVQDLICAADHLKQQYEEPNIMIGHSLGGAAAILAASLLQSIEAVVTIGAPADPPHVKHLFESSLEEIDQTGFARVSIGGRPFTIKKQFIEDLEKNDLTNTIASLKKPLLVFHSPQDEIVDIKNAERIYTAAHHPKSYVSLNKADHLLTNKKDATYVGEVIASWAERYVSLEKQLALDTDHQVVVRNERDNGYLSEVMANGHYLKADEPQSVGGDNLGGTPYDLLVASLGACTAITLRMYAKHKKLPLEEIKVHLSRIKAHAGDAKKLDMSSLMETIEMELELTGDLTEEQRNRVLDISYKCPVHKTLTKGLQVNTKLKD